VDFIKVNDKLFTEKLKDGNTVELTMRRESLWMTLHGIYIGDAFRPEDGHQRSCYATGKLFNNRDIAVFNGNSFTDCDVVIRCSGEDGCLAHVINDRITYDETRSEYLSIDLPVLDKIFDAMISRLDHCEDDEKIVLRVSVEVFRGVMDRSLGEPSDFSTYYLESGSLVNAEFIGLGMRRLVRGHESSKKISDENEGKLSSDAIPDDKEVSEPYRIKQLVFAIYALAIATIISALIR